MRTGLHRNECTHKRIYKCETNAILIQIREKGQILNSQHLKPLVPYLVPLFHTLTLLDLHFVLIILVNNRTESLLL